MSFWELFIILIVALVVIKPERLPEIAYTLGRWLRLIQGWYQNILQKYNTPL